jgi:peptidoglycan-associated lipoprotein
MSGNTPSHRATIAVAVALAAVTLAGCQQPQTTSAPQKRATQPTPAAKAAATTATTANGAPGTGGARSARPRGAAGEAGGEAAEASAGSPASTGAPVNAARGAPPGTNPNTAALAREDSISIAAAAAENVFVRARAVLVERIQFESKSAELRLPERNMLDEKAALLKANGDVRLRIDGHIDAQEKGKGKETTPLALQRANAVLKYLVSRGIDAGRLEAAASGEANPRCTEQSEYCWSQNRRVELTIAAGGEKIRPAK